MNAFCTGVQLVRRADAFDRRDLMAFGFDGEHRAGINRFAIEQHGAGAARRAVANFFRAGDVEPIAQRVEQCNARLDVQSFVLPIDLECDGQFSGTANARIVFRGFRPVALPP
jgi:hypothetical protein